MSQFTRHFLQNLLIFLIAYAVVGTLFAIGYLLSAIFGGPGIGAFALILGITLSAILAWLQSR